jgi:hypothetical protein
LLLCSGGNDFLRRLGTPEPGLRIAPPAFYAGIAKEFGLP